MDIPKNAKIFIIEGIAGSGKDTLHNQLKEKLKGFVVYDFSEEELIYSWKHAWIKDIDKIRLEFMNNLLDYIEKTLDENRDARFILNRFHISFYILMVSISKINKNLLNEYDKFIKRLEKLPVQVYVPVLDEHQIEGRSSHRERKEKIWELHLKKRLETRDFSTLKDMYMWEQEQVLKLLKKQRILYELIKVKVNH